jgi:hypothetical protein
MKFTPAFKIFKQGRTTDWITILNPNDGTFNVENKKEFYLSLGYSVK